MIKVIAMIVIIYYLMTTAIFIKYYESNFKYLYISFIISVIIGGDQEYHLEGLEDRDKYPKGILTLIHRTLIVVAFTPLTRWKALKELLVFKKVVKTNVFASIVEGHYAHLSKTDPSRLESLDYFLELKEELGQ